MVVFCSIVEKTHLTMTQEKVLERRKFFQYFTKIEHRGSISEEMKNQDIHQKKTPLERGVYNYAFLTSLRRAAFPWRSRMYRIFFRRTLYCRITSTFSSVGQEIGNVFSIPSPAVTRRTVKVFSPFVFPAVRVITPANF